MKIKCVIIEDEPFALRLVKDYVQRNEALELIETFSNPILACDYLQSNVIDLAFVDINMPDLDGITLSKMVKDRTKVIFTTAYKDYALEGYKVNAIDYLLKPFSYEEFAVAVEKAKDHFQLVRNQKEEGEFIYVRADHKQYKIFLNDLLYIENMKNYVVFRLQDGSKVMALMSLRSLQETLPENFIKVHRSFIVNILFIDQVRTSSVQIGSNEIPISDSHKKEFKSQMAEQNVN